MVDGAIPASWTITGTDAEVVLGPPELSSLGFWSQFWDERGPDDDGRWVQPTYRVGVHRLIEDVGTEFDRRALSQLPEWVPDAKG